ncbi:MAG: hypothetical protein QNJ55_31960 [Xenococcus sp. MO_188.B8]|nr:hypothetical protein [Xenococcus sp. MO_188.B8]
MKAYELTANVTADGQVELPDFRLSPTSPQPATVKVIILVSEPEETNNQSTQLDENFSEESFKRSWQQAMEDETIPLSQLWKETDIA